MTNSTSYVHRCSLKTNVLYFIIAKGKGTLGFEFEIGFFINSTGTTEYSNEGEKKKAVPQPIHKICSGLIITLNVKGKIIKLLKESKIISS